MIVELGLTAPPLNDAESGSFNQFSMGQLPKLRPRLVETRTMNERRAVLSFYVLSSMLVSSPPISIPADLNHCRISQYLGRMDPLRWTPHMADSLDILRRSSESPNDAVLVQLTRARLLAAKISAGSWNDSLSTETPFSRAPVSFHISALRSQIEEIKAQIPTELQNNSASS